MDASQQSNSSLDGAVTLLKSSWEVYKKHWKILSTLFVIPSVINLISSLASFQQGSASIWTSGILTLLSIIASFILVPVGILAVSRLDQGQVMGMSVSSVFRSSLVFLIPLLLLYVLEGLIILGAAVFLVIPALLISYYVFFSAYCLIIDGKKGFSAFEESFRLVKDQFFPIVWRFLFAALVTMGVGIIFAGAQYLLGIMFGIPNPLGFKINNVLPAPLMSRTMLAGIMTILSTVLVAPLTAIYTFKIYDSLKKLTVSGSSTKNFRKIIIGFMVVGIIVTVFAISVLPTVVSKVIDKIKAGEVNSSKSLGASVMDSELLQNIIK
jgi:hypothetical protein